MASRTAPIGMPPFRMPVLLRIARREFVEYARDGRLWSVAAIIVILLGAALAAGAVTARDIDEQHDAAREATRRNWLEQGRKDPHVAAHYGVYAFKPIQPLSFVDRGVDAYAGTTTWLEAHRQNAFQHRPARDATALARLGEFTAATILQLVLPLLIVTLGFGAFATERERGLLRFAVGCGVAPTTLFAGKVVGLGALLSTILLPACALGATALVLTTGGWTDEGLGSRAAWLTVSYLVYLAAFVALTLAVSARARSAKGALLALLAFWAATGLVAPRVAAEIAGRAFPTPSSAEFAARVADDLLQGLDGHNPLDARRAELERRVLAQYGVSRIQDLPVNFGGIALQESENYSNQVFDKRFGELWAIFNRQNRLKELAGVVSPLLAVRSISMGLAGTDLDHYRHFVDAAEAYRRDLVRAMNEDLIEHGGPVGTRYAVDREVWEQVPAFVYTPPDARSVLSRRSLAVGVLAGWALVGVVLALYAGRRMAVA